MSKSLVAAAPVATATTAHVTPSVHGVLVSLSLSVLLSSLGASIANVGLPTFARVFGASFQAVQWVVLAYLLSITSLVLVVGRLGDIVGRRRLLRAGIALFTAASVVCGASPGLWVLVGARAVQGMGAAIMMVLGMALIGETVPKGRTGSAMGLLGTMSAVGTALGPSLGGTLIVGMGWRVLFLVNVPLGILTLFLVRRHLPIDRRERTSRDPHFDYTGVLVLVATLVAYALAMTLGRGRFGALNVALLATAAVGLWIFVRTEGRAASPLIQLTTLRDTVLRASLATSALVATVVMATLVVGPFYLSHALGLEPALVGVVMTVGPLVAAIAGVPAGRIADRFGTHRSAQVGLVCMSSGSALLSTLPTTLGVTGYVAPIAVLTAGYALFQAANNAAMMKAVRADERGMVAGMLGLSRNVGLVTGASVMGAVFAAASGSADVATAPSGAVAAGMRITFAIATLLILVAMAIAAGRHAPRLVRPPA